MSMTAPSEILERVELFDRNRDAYLSGRYKEAQLRLEFVDPFFEEARGRLYTSTSQWPPSREPSRVQRP
jgi:hypothetical protein